MANGQCRISSFKGNLSIVFEENEPDELSLFNDQPLIFKLRNDWTGAGRQVSGITKGHFVVIAPNHRERMGHVPVEPEGCVDTGFTAHYFFRDGTESNEEVGGFRECADLLGTSRVELTGERVHDDSESGELFVSAVPNLKSFPDLVWARVGEEREGGWTGENFKPAEQCLADVLHGRQGRFFIRVYGKDSRLLDSEEFRYFADLREIRVNGEPYSEDALLVPSPTGHPPTEVRFVGVDGGTVHPLLTGDGTHAVVQSGGILIVAPHPQGDDVFCALGSDTGRVDIVIKLPRIWWQIERDDGAPAGRDTPLAMTRQQFQEYADAGVALRVRLPKRIRSAGVGFGADMDRSYSSQHTEDNTTCAIPLTDFIDYSQIDQRLNKDVSLNVECGATLNLIRVSADPVPTITTFTCEPAALAAGEKAALYWSTRDAEARCIVIDPEIGTVESSGSLKVVPSETTTYTLRLTASGLDDVTESVTVILLPLLPPGGKASARVKHTCGDWRPGKGFSRGELDAAGLTDAAAARRSVPTDRRRRSTHPVNIDILRRLSDA